MNGLINGFQLSPSQLEGFEEFWKAYPRKKSKGIAKLAWHQTAGIRPSLPELLSVLEQHKKQEDWLCDGGMFIPYLASWLRAERWEDELVIDLGANVNGKQWHETASGIEAKGSELNISPEQFDDWQAFRAAVLRAVRRHGMLASRQTVPG